MFPNLAFPCERKIFSDDYLLITTEDILFDKYNRHPVHIPPPSLIYVKRSEIEPRGGHMERLTEKKSKILKDIFVYIDSKVVEELRNAGIEIEKVERLFDKEVPTQYVGHLGQYSFIRGWIYWIVIGDTNKDLAMKIYNDPVGRKVIRTNGFAGNISPEDQYKVDSYHIDTSDGLKRFVELVSPNSYKTPYL
jgi:hypothetical protein